MVGGTPLQGQVLAYGGPRASRYVHLCDKANLGYITYPAFSRAAYMQDTLKGGTA